MTSSPSITGKVLPALRVVHYGIRFLGSSCCVPPEQPYEQRRSSPAPQTRLGRQSPSVPPALLRWRIIRAATGMAGCAVVGGCIGFLLGNGDNFLRNPEFWKVAAQPMAVLVTGAAAITVAGLALHNGNKTRALDAEHHRMDSLRAQEVALRERYTTAAGQLGDTQATIREAGAHVLGALADDWREFGAATGRPELGLSELRVCIGLLTSYLRGQGDSTPSCTADQCAGVLIESEKLVRHTIIRILTERASQWRELGLEIEADLSYADLRGTDLRNFDLEGADLTGAKLVHVRLDWSYLGKAELLGADLTGANLTGTTLTEANLFGAKLFGADLTVADLAGANLFGAKLGGANLTKANLTRAVLALADLSGANLTGTDFTKSTLALTTAQHFKIDEMVFDIARHLPEETSVVAHDRPSRT